MLDREEYQRWIKEAKHTLRSARADRERGDYNWACFKAQQAAELAVKGLLRGIGNPAYGHSVTRLLLEAASQLGQAEEELVDCAKLLDKMYIPTRYPDAWSEGSPHFYYTRADADKAIDCAQAIIDWVKEAWRKLEKSSGNDENSSEG